MEQEASPGVEPRVLRLDQGVGYQTLLHGQPQTRGMRSGCVALAQGEECGQHTTKAHEELLVVLEGGGVVRLEGRDDLPIAKGHLAYIPPHTIHNVVNTGAAVLRYIYVVAPLTD